MPEKIIRDPVHDVIAFRTERPTDGLLFRLLNAAEFQRLRRVRQLGGRFRNDVIETYPNVSQFWQYDPQRYLALPPYSKMKGAWARP